ncbi:hypothetical protein [Myxococcus sp. CA039A]|uniref:hypothetical protein n=1 Tax=Myxococcus sp. CA039A TaxID=2741737 RepID=UPI00157B0381|nr:hypothetical protein [Myxococcus sp. CA039A]
MARMPASRWRLRWHAVAVCLLLTSWGCAFVTPRFPQDIQTSFARDPIRKLTTASLELYYPEQLRGPALRMAARLEGCVEQLRAQTWRKEPRARVLVYMTSADFNNAYVVPDYASIPQQMVVPANVTLELFHLFGLGEVDIGDVACHEAVHYVQLQQTNGLWGFLNDFTGGLFQPNTFTESWFLEGLATYYEGRFGKDTGRPHSPVWRGWFDSVVQARDGRMDPGFLSPENRALDPFGGNYLTGMHFVEYLATKYGEAKLWKLVDNQGTTVIPPIAVTLRFKGVYGKDIGSLFAEYTKDLREQLIVRERPQSQRVWIPEAGYFSRLASHPSTGVTALVSVGREQYSRLTVREPDGHVRFERPLVELLPFRRWVLGSSTLVSGMSFSADGEWLYLVMADLNAVGAYDAKLWRVDAHTGEVVRVWDDVKGMGGSVTPDGAAYVYVRVEGDTANLRRLELESGKQEQLTHFDASAPLGPPAVSPDGTRMVFPLKGNQGWDLVVREADGSLRWLTRDGLFNYSPRWLDADRIVFLREDTGRLQAHVMTVSTRELARITDAPFLVMDVSPMGTGEVAFLNRDGASFTIDRAAVSAMAERVNAAVLPSGMQSPTSSPDEAPSLRAEPGVPPANAPAGSGTGTPPPSLADTSPMSPPPLTAAPAVTTPAEQTPPPPAPEELSTFPSTAPPGGQNAGMSPEALAAFPGATSSESPDAGASRDTLTAIPSTTPSSAPDAGTLAARPGTSALGEPDAGTSPDTLTSTRDAGTSSPAQAQGPATSEPPPGGFTPFPPGSTDTPVEPAPVAPPLAGALPVEPIASTTGNLEAPVGAPPPDPGKPVTVLTDEPYSTLEGFLIPEFRLPYLWVARESDDSDDLLFSGGLSLAGQDRLGFHAYALNFSYSTQDQEPNVSLAYGNAQLAPWYLQASVARVRENERTDLQALAYASRTFWTTPVTIGVLALHREYDAVGQFPRLVTRLIGPEVSMSYFAGDATSYGGLQRGLGISVSGAVYPGAFALDSTVGDVRLGLDGFFGGFFGGKDNLQLSAVGRYLPGAPEGLLEVGGFSAGQTWYSSRRSTETSRLPLQLQPGIAFSEYVRGYEDITIRARNALIGGATYRYRIIVDHGWASTLWLLPSLFVRNFEMDVFATLARTDNRDNHGAFGAAMSIQFTMGQAVPFSLFYQFARRYDDGLGDLHLVGIGL